MSLLQWKKPVKARSTDAHNRTYSSDSGVAGTYVPNMSDEDNEAWKAKKIADRVEIRKLFGGTQGLIVVHKDGGLTLSANGKLHMDADEYQDFRAALIEAREALK